MHKVYQVMSDIILPGTVFLAVLAILVGAALLSGIGKRMEAPQEDFSQMADVQAVESLCERELPDIRCVQKKRWDAGEHILVPQVFTAADADGNKIEVSVLDITDQDGASAMGFYKKENGLAVFPKRGVYTFLLAAEDGEQKRCTKWISLLVDQR